MNEKIVLFGGGSGLSTLLRGMKLFPVDITAVVSVCDDGKSTGRLREEFNIPAVGDIRKVMASLSQTQPIFEDIFNYRFNTTSDLDGHTLGNLFLTAAAEVTGSVSNAIESLSDILKLKGKILPLTEDLVVLIGKMEDGMEVYGEHNITASNKKIMKVYYEKEPIINKEVLKAIRNADLIVLSMGSLFTSIIPNLICKEVIREIDKSKAKILYVCNMMTQPGETDNFKASDHVNLINEYLGKRKIDIVIANSGNISEDLAQKYKTLEQKDKVELDFKKLKKVKVISDDLVTVEDGWLRHDYVKTSFYIFSTLLKKQ